MWCVEQTVGRPDGGQTRSSRYQIFSLMKVALEMKYDVGFHHFHNRDFRGFLIYHSWLPAGLFLKNSACYKFFPPSLRNFNNALGLIDDVIMIGALHRHPNGNLKHFVHDMDKVSSHVPKRLGVFSGWRHEYWHSNILRYCLRITSCLL